MLHVFHHVTMFPYGWVGLKYVGGGQSKSRFLLSLNRISFWFLVEHHTSSLLPVHAELVRSHGHVRLLRSSRSRSLNAKVFRLETLHHSDSTGMETVFYHFYPRKLRDQITFLLIWFSGSILRRNDPLHCQHFCQRLSFPQSILSLLSGLWHHHHGLLRQLLRPFLHQKVETRPQDLGTKGSPERLVHQRRLEFRGVHNRQTWQSAFMSGSSRTTLLNDFLDSKWRNASNPFLVRINLRHFKSNLK